MKNMKKVVFLSVVTLTSLTLLGCSGFKRNPPPTNSSIILFDDPQQLQGIRHDVIGAISGAACQVSLNDPLVTIRQAEMQIQRQAQRQGANAVLIENCEIIQSVPGCVRQTVCKGQSIKFIQID